MFKNILIIVVVLGGIIFLATRSDRGEIKNVDMFSGNGAEIVSQEVNYFEDAQGLYAHPKEPGNYPGVVMIHENRGLRPEIRQMAEKLAAEGYMVLAVDLFSGAVVDSQEDARALTEKFSPGEGIKNMRAAAEFLREQGATKLASLGWCFGGGQSLELALSGEKLDATVIYYGRLKGTAEELEPISWPVLGIFGGKDTVISVQSVRTFEAALAELNVPNEIHVYPDVGHAFANPSGMNYAPVETRDAWANTLTFLDKNLKQ